MGRHRFTLHTTSIKEAKSLPTLRDLEWDAKFAAYSHSADGPDAAQTSALAQPLSNTELIQLVRDYVERQDQVATKRETSCYPEKSVTKSRDDDRGRGRGPNPDSRPVP